jgi:hypothetical protein
MPRDALAMNYIFAVILGLHGLVYGRGFVSSTNWVAQLRTS